MKKKLILIFSIVIISFLSMFFAKKLQSKVSQPQKQIKFNVEANKEDKKDIKEEKKIISNNQNKESVEKKQEDKSNIQSKAEQKKQNTISKEKKQTTSAEVKKPQKSPNIYIINTIDSKVIYKGYVDLSSKTAADVTIEVLIKNKIPYRAKGTGSTIYFSSIAGLKERDKGANSGWCYYVNGVKASVGSGAYVLKDGDILEWRYLEDGLK